MRQALEKMEREKDVQILKLKTEQELQEKGKHHCISDGTFDCLVPEVKNGYFTVYAKWRGGGLACSTHEYKLNIILLLC